METVYDIGFRCHYGTNFTQHKAFLPLKDIPKWIEAYHFTHPDVRSISVCVWLNMD